MRHSRRRSAAFVLCAVALVAGCSVDGSPVRGPVDLDTGPYLSRQSSALTQATTEVDWAQVRGVRLADHLVFARDIDPVLAELKLPTQPLARAENLATVAVGAADTPAAKSFEYGFTVSAGTEDGDTSVNYSLVKFTDDAAARDAVTQFVVPLLRKDEYTRVAELTRIAGLPADSRAVHQTSTYGAETTIGLSAVGPYLIHTWAQSDKAKDRAWTERAVLAGYEKQKPLVDAIPPESTDRNPDPTGLMRGNVAPEEDGDPLQHSVLGQRGAAVLFDDGPGAFAMLRKAGVTAVAIGDTWAYLTAGESQARGLRDSLIAEFTSGIGRKEPSPRDLPSAACAENSDRFSCSVAVGKHVGTAMGATLVEAQQKVSAQYTFLSKM
ncbi:hypothetical protein nbrc107696_32250 [Gordonia spumicola]|uniref:Lipoprotein n=1 Tax=Gordonia spumicola TaxID=589161 RepID=A0A7I9VBP5_9ACTN|nr:hypothetical protein [Gordonia spumicola]GEE02779.1 hypothetical protein nbrc107696_32250 [Gordonia spumicola]